MTQHQLHILIAQILFEYISNHAFKVDNNQHFIRI